MVLRANPADVLNSVILKCYVSVTILLKFSRASNNEIQSNL